MLSLKKYDKNSIGLIGHTVVNYPSPAIICDTIDVMVNAGVDLIELQIPFSEPIADGPVLLKANHEALARGVNWTQSLELMKEVSQKYKIPFVFMTYANIAYKPGFVNFVKLAKQAGAWGAIIPDLPVELADDYLAACREYDFAAIQVVPPNVSEERLKQLTEAATGLIYAVARSGVTGKHTDMNEQLTQFINRIRQYTDLPISVGFGIAAKQDVDFLKPIADYAVVGTQALRVLHEQGVEGLRKFWQSLL